MRSHSQGPVYVESADGSVSGFLDDILKPMQDFAQQAQGSQAGQAVQNLFSSQDFERAVSNVERDIQSAISEQSSKNSVNLFLLAVAGGAVGSMFLRGTTGLLIAGGLALFATSRMSSAPSTQKK